MTTRSKTSTQSPSKEDFFAWVNQIAALQLDIAARKTAKEKELQTLKTKHEEPIKPLQKELDGLLQKAMKYMLANQDELLPKGKRSSSTTLANYGLRMGQPTIDAGEGLKLPELLDILIAMGEEGKPYLTTKQPALAIDAIRLNMPPALFDAIGFVHIQDETFWVSHKPTPKQKK